MIKLKTIKIFKNKWLWLILIFVLILSIYTGIRLEQTKYCLRQDHGSYEYFHKDFGMIEILGCPPRCVMASCFRIMTACCPKVLGVERVWLEIIVYLFPFILNI